MAKFLLFFLIFTSQAYAEFRYWNLNEDHSNIFFDISYLGGGEVTGRFTKLAGFAEFAEDGTPLNVSVEIGAASIDTGNKMRDNHLRSSDFLKSKEHPQITFNSQHLSRKNNGRYLAEGTLTLAGIEKPATMEFELTKAAVDTWGYNSRFAKFKGSVKRSDYSITWNKTLGGDKFLVGDVISFKGSLQLQPVKGMTPKSKHMIPDTSYMRRREKIKRGELPADAKMIIAKEASAQVTLPNTKPVLVEASGPGKENSKTAKSLAWWVAFSCLGMLGFFASIILGLHSKKIISENFQGKYTETGILGHLSDFVTIIYVVIYSVAMWFVGWG